MLKVFIPSICQSEQRYALDILLSEFLGLAFEVEAYEGEYIEIIRSGDYHDSAKLTLDASFFYKAHRDWLKPKSMPVLPLANWTPAKDGIEATLVESSVPVLYGKSHPNGDKGLIKKENGIHINVDIFGGAFFMLSRYEELITPIRDEHDRFPASASVAYNANFLDRPIVNEYLEILWQCLHTLWPDLRRKEREFRQSISCDVDHPFDLAGYSFKRTIFRIGARIIRDKNPKLALYDALNYVFKKFGSDRFDEYRNNIDWMMRVNKQAGNKVAFFFIPVQTDSNKEDLNDIRSKKISNLIKHIVNSGHEIGFHPGYKTYRFNDEFKHSANVLKDVCKEMGINISGFGGRQHYLRYDVGRTPRLWDENGFVYDSSLGYADMAGFRAGICYEYTMFDLLKRKKMVLKQRPLIVMEGTVISRSYENLGFGQVAFDRIEYFNKICEKYQGLFTLLWHNSFFMVPSSKKLYVEIVNNYKNKKSRV